LGCGQRAPCPQHGKRQATWTEPTDAVIRPVAQTLHGQARYRGSAHSRGYGERWRKYRKWFIAELFRLEVPRAGLCGARLPGAPMTQDSLCAQFGIITGEALGTVLDHIVPVTGPNDPSFYVPEGHQLLCARCHDRKRQSESVAARYRGGDRISTGALQDPQAEPSRRLMQNVKVSNGRD